MTAAIPQVPLSPRLSYLLFLVIRCEKLPFPYLIVAPLTAESALHIVRKRLRRAEGASADVPVKYVYQASSQTLPDLGRPSPGRISSSSASRPVLVTPVIEPARICCLTSVLMTCIIGFSYSLLIIVASSILYLMTFLPFTIYTPFLRPCGYKRPSAERCVG